MAYFVKELFYTLQGEGAQTGCPAVFCRLSGCNLWSGREADRSEAICRFCDTDFIGTDGQNGGRFESAELLAEAVLQRWGGDAAGAAQKLVVCTGGEPALQVDGPLLESLKARGFRVAMETNGTLPLPTGIDWVCVSPKAGAPLKVLEGQELKLVFPQEGAEPALFEDLQFEHLFLQPKDGPERVAHTEAAIQYCLDHPRWRLSLQTHKWTGID